MAVASAAGPARRRQPAASRTPAACALISLAVLAVSSIYLTIPYPIAWSPRYALAAAGGIRRRRDRGRRSPVPVVLVIIGFSSPHGLLNWETPQEPRAGRTRRLVLGVAEHQPAAGRTDEETRGRVVEERLRIARDVHDVVAHAMVAINVQAGVGAHLLDRDPDQARRTLLDIKQTSGEALADLRSTLGVLRNHDDDDDVPVTPTLSLRELETCGPASAPPGCGSALDLDPASGGAAGLGRRDGLPHRARGAHQRAAPRELRRGVGARDPARRRGGDRGRGRRFRTAYAAARPGARHRQRRARHARAGAALSAAPSRPGPRPGGGWRVAASLPVGASV